MSISSEQKTFLETSVKQGLSLSQIQDAFNSRFNLHLTYMEVRCLVADLEIELNENLNATQKQKEDAERKETVAPSLGKVQVSVDPVARPGLLFSGNVTFSDGIQSTWQLDQTGRLGLVPSQKGYRPSESDLKEFQSAIQSELEKNNF